MIANRLNILLAERQLTIKDVVENTTLSRNTISNLVNKNMTSSVNLSTLNELCMFLNISPSDFFTYSPYDLEIEIQNIKDSLDLILQIWVKHNTDTSLIECVIKNDSVSETPIKGKLVHRLQYKLIDSEEMNAKGLYDSFNLSPKRLISIHSSESIKNIISSVDIMFQKQIKDKIEYHVMSKIIKQNNLREVKTSDNSDEEFIIAVEYPWKLKYEIFVKKE
ncbi:hypothetical protein LAKU_20c00130 [Apilactobacillus kunkeei EFB6]|uniref:HTH cro/C1-type domain-containing protein n=1 Tax=Apilactobacillus kunkeei EFB6 TaxID=1419324 RepID=A0A837B047_9LACO|nr:helix-turn-helix transcriptional regulator [Apilactobacillus kunkeei]KDB00568.1 hypothetical protein LAKU_20c00130 [Apilactobacillus kunkeei EFB6]